MIKHIIISIILIIISSGAGFYFGQQSIIKKIEDNFKTITSEYDQKNLMPTDAKAEKPVVIKKEIGDVVEFATIKFSIIRSEEKEMLQSKYSQPLVAEEGLKFVILDVDVENITTAPFDFSSDGIVLEDDKGVQYDPYRNTISNIDNYIEMRQLAPQIKESGAIVYLVPDEYTNYSLVIKKGGTNEVYKISAK